MNLCDTNGGCLYFEIEDIVEDVKNHLDQKTLLAVFLVCLFFFGVYFSLSLYMARSNAFTENDLLFSIVAVIIKIRDISSELHRLFVPLYYC